MKKLISLSCFIIVCCGLSLAASPPSQDVAQDVAARLKQMSASHPRLFFTNGVAAGLKAKIDGDALLSSAYGHLKAEADAVINLEPVKREKVGKRLLGVSRTCLQRVSYLAFAYAMTKEESYLQRAKQEMLAAAAFEDWNPSHFLDVAEMTAALAVGYDWLYDDLGAEARKAIRDAIVKKGLETSMKGGSWVTGTNNWNQVCHGGLVLGALAVLEDSPELSERIIARAQQYDFEMHPVWARKFEPPAITGGESQGVLRVLLDLHARTKDPRYLDSAGRALEYLKKSRLPGGKLARFYELRTNTPLYFTKSYELTYGDQDTPTHYAFVTPWRLDAIEADYLTARDGSPRVSQKQTSDAHTGSVPGLAERAKAVIEALDARGAWGEQGKLRYHGEDVTTREVIDSQTFIHNVGTLASFIAAGKR